MSKNCEICGKIMYDESRNICEACATQPIKQEEHPMKWYKFLAYGLIWLIVLGDIATIVNLLGGTDFVEMAAQLEVPVESMYAAFGSGFETWKIILVILVGVKTVFDIYMGICLVAKKSAATRVWLTWILNAFLNILELVWLLMCCDGVQFSEYWVYKVPAESMISVVIASGVAVAVAIANAKYFEKRAYEFVK